MKPAFSTLGAFVALGAVAVMSACVGELHENIGEASAVESDAGARPATVLVSFDRDIQPDIDALSCSTAGCHGSAIGGLRLVKSATGAELAANYDAFKAHATGDDLAKVLVKATGGEGHVGGTRFAKTDAIYARWLAWIRQGSPR